MQRDRGRSVLMKFSICNLGCKVNAYEAESVASLLEKKGWERVDFDEQADAALIFTCAVTNTAASKSRKMMHRIKRNFPECAVAMVGCYAQIDDGMLKDAEIIVGSSHKKDLPQYIDEYFETKKPVRVLDDLKDTPFETLSADGFDSRARAYLKIQDGCNQFCTYCVIPYVRGRERSMAPDTAVKEAVRISKDYREIVLTGIHTGRYGREYGVSLAELMERILNEAVNLERLRISSIEITEIDDHLIRLMKTNKRIARHLHIPLQAGSDEILSAMGRPYTTDEYFEKIEAIRKELDGVSVSCDLITGFPGETDEMFARTLQFIEKCRFSFLHVFPYSPRVNTVAAAMDHQISPEVKKKRTSEAMQLSQKLADEFRTARLGNKAEVMCEESEDGYTKGYTSEYIPVRIKGVLPHGTMAAVRLSEYRDHMMYGEVINNETDTIV